MAYDNSKKQKALNLLRSGVDVKYIHEELDIPEATLYRWKSQLDSHSSPTAKDETLEYLLNQINILITMGKDTPENAKKIAMLTNSYNKLKNQKDKENSKQARKAKRKADKKEKPIVTDDKVIAKLREKLLSDEYGLYEYQKKFISDQSQFRLTIKARQIGFSYIAGAEAAILAAGGRDQLFLSASEEQALILIKYAKLHCDKLGLEYHGSETEIVINGAGTIKALAHNFRTVQGFTGDVWMDEFAWYPNPKKIWMAFVPSIGAIKGKLTIMSTPFEEQSLFYNLVHDTQKYFMFSRFRVTIYDAIKDGMPFDLEVMRALFDEDTWASAYECQFIDDESSFFPISLIKSVVDEKLHYYTPAANVPLRSGYDIGRKKDLSSLAAFEKIKEIYTLAKLDILKKASFETQKHHLFDFMRYYSAANLNLDMTGIGMNLAEDTENAFQGRAKGIYFTAVSKEQMTLNFKKLMEDKQMRLPNDPMLIADIHAIKRKAGQKKMIYDSDRNTYGHSDRYWACALALKDLDPFNRLDGGSSGGGALVCG